MGQWDDDGAVAAGGGGGGGGGIASDGTDCDIESCDTEDLNADNNQTLGTRSYDDLVSGMQDALLQRIEHEERMAADAKENNNNNESMRPKSKAGYLFKESKSKREQWRRCWFKFTGDKCDYHKKDRKSPVVGSIICTDILSCRVSNKRRKHYCFVVAVDNRGLYYFAADSYEDMREWMQCLVPTQQNKEVMESAGAEVVHKIEAQNHELHLQKEKILAEIDRVSRDKEKLRNELDDAKKEVARLDDKDHENEKIIAELNAKQALGTTQKTSVCVVQ